LTDKYRLQKETNAKGNSGTAREEVLQSGEPFPFYQKVKAAGGSWSGQQRREKQTEQKTSFFLTRRTAGPKSFM